MASQVSATGSANLDGSVDLFVDWHNAAWANGILEPGNIWPLNDGYNPNQRTVSLEREDGGDPTVLSPNDQVEGIVAFWRAAKLAHPELYALTGHNCISPQSRSCPSGFLNGQLAEVCQEVGLDYIEYAQFGG